MFHLGFPEYSCRYNPIGDYGRITEVATRIANQLPSEGQSAAFRDFVWRFVNVLTKTMEGLSIKPSYENIYKSAANVDELAGDYLKRYWISITLVGSKTSTILICPRRKQKRSQDRAQLGHDEARFFLESQKAQRTSYRRIGWYFVQ